MLQLKYLKKRFLFSLFFPNVVVTLMLPISVFPVIHSSLTSIEETESDGDILSDMIEYVAEGHGLGRSESGKSLK